MQKLSFQEQLLNCYDYLKPFALRFTKHEEAARDLVQETVFLAWKNQHRFFIDEESNMKAWLFTIMRNTFINMCRRNKTHSDGTRYSTDDYTNQLLLNTQNTVYSTLGIQRINSLLSEMPEIFKIPLLLFADGYKYAEIAKILDLSEGTVKSRLHFGRRLLKEHLNITDSIQYK